MSSTVTIGLTDVPAWALPLVEFNDGASPADFRQWLKNCAQVLRGMCKVSHVFEHLEDPDIVEDLRRETEQMLAQVQRPNGAVRAPTSKMSTQPYHADQPDQPAARLDGLMADLVQITGNASLGDGEGEHGTTTVPPPSGQGDTADNDDHDASNDKTSQLDGNDNVSCCQPMCKGLTQTTDESLLLSVKINEIESVKGTFGKTTLLKTDYGIDIDVNYSNVNPKNLKVYLPISTRSIDTNKGVTVIKSPRSIIDTINEIMQEEEQATTTENVNDEVDQDKVVNSMTTTLNLPESRGDTPSDGETLTFDALPDAFGSDYHIDPKNMDQISGVKKAMQLLPRSVVEAAVVRGHQEPYLVVKEKLNRRLGSTEVNEGTDHDYVAMRELRSIMIC